MVLPAQRHRAPTAAPAIGAPAQSLPDAQAAAEQPLTGHFADRPAPRAWGWATPGGGRSANVEGGMVYQATSAQVCGLYPFALSSGAATPGVPIGRHMLTAEPALRLCHPPTQQRALIPSKLRAWEHLPGARPAATPSGGLIPGPSTNRWPYRAGPLTTPALTFEGDLELTPGQPPTDSAPATSSWPGAKGDTGDLFTPRQQHTAPPSSSHQHASSPPSPGRETGHPVQAQVDQPAPQHPQRWALPRLSRPRVTAGGLTLALPAAAVIVLLTIAYHRSAPAPTPPLVTQVPGPATSPAATAAAPLTTIPLPAPAPADAAEPSLAPAPVSSPRTSPVIPQVAPASDGAAQAVDPQPSTRISQHPTAALPAPPPWSADQPSRWHWDKTTTCDPSGHCVDHYNPKPTTPDQGWASPPPASNTTGSTQPSATRQPTPWHPSTNTTHNGP